MLQSKTACLCLPGRQTGLPVPVRQTGRSFDRRSFDRRSNMKLVGAIRTIGIALILLAGMPLLALSVPRICADADRYNFAPVIEGIAVIHTFILRNTGDRPLEIEQVRTSCPACTFASLSKTTLAPGEEATLRILFDTTSRSGACSTGVYVYSNDPRRPRLHLILHGTIIPNKPYHMAAKELYLDFYSLIDLRSMQEHAAGHLIGAVNIPYAELLQSADRLPRDHLIILLCTDGELSDRMVPHLRAANFNHVWSLHGGLNHWQWQYGDQYLLKKNAVDAERPAPTKDPFSEERLYHIRAAQLRRFLHIIVDIRLPTEYTRSHISGAINVPHDEISQWLNDLGNLPRCVPIILYCRSGKKSAYAVQILLAAGFGDARSLLGGLIEWQRRFDQTLIFVSNGRES